MSMIISFAWTTKPFIAGRKCVTRRYWKLEHARKFKKGDVVQVYDKTPRIGGKKIGEIRLLSDPFIQPTSFLKEEDYEKEGFKYMEENNLTINGKDPRKMFDEWKLADDPVWVIKFEKVR